jgi:hypothetical protein
MTPDFLLATGFEALRVLETADFAERTVFVTAMADVFFRVYAPRPTDRSSPVIV